MMIAAWIIATVAPPATFPSATAVRDTGATRTSRRNPNSRSHTIEMAENSAVNSTRHGQDAGEQALDGRCRRRSPGGCPR